LKLTLAAKIEHCAIARPWQITSIKIGASEHQIGIDFRKNKLMSLNGEVSGEQ